MSNNYNFYPTLDGLQNIDANNITSTNLISDEIQLNRMMLNEIDFSNNVTTTTLRYDTSNDLNLTLPSSANFFNTNGQLSINGYGNVKTKLDGLTTDVSGNSLKLTNVSYNSGTNTTTISGTTSISTLSVSAVTMSSLNVNTINCSGSGNGILSELGGALAQYTLLAGTFPRTYFKNDGANFNIIFSGNNNTPIWTGTYPFQINCATSKVTMGNDCAINGIFSLPSYSNVKTTLDTITTTLSDISYNSGTNTTRINNTLDMSLNNIENVNSLKIKFEVQFNDVGSGLTNKGYFKMENNILEADLAQQNNTEFALKMWNGTAMKYINFNTSGINMNGLSIINSNLNSDITTIQSDVTTIQSDINTIQSDINTIQSDIITIQSDITDIYTKIQNDPFSQVNIFYDFENGVTNTYFQALGTTSAIISDPEHAGIARFECGGSGTNAGIRPVQLVKLYYTWADVISVEYIFRINSADPTISMFFGMATDYGTYTDSVMLKFVSNSIYYFSVNNANTYGCTALAGTAPFTNNWMYLKITNTGGGNASFYIHNRSTGYIDQYNYTGAGINSSALIQPIARMTNNNATISKSIDLDCFCLKYICNRN